MLLLPQRRLIVPAAPGGGGAVAVNHHSISTWNAPGGSGTTYSFSSFDIGLDSEGALYLAVMLDYGTGAPTDVTVGGSSAGSAIASTGTVEFVGFYRMAAPGDGPVTVTVVQSTGSFGSCAISAFRASGASATLNDSTAAAPAFPTTTLDVATVADGAVLAAAVSRATDRTITGVGTQLNVDNTSSEFHAGYNLTTTAETRTVNVSDGTSAYGHGVSIALAAA